MVHSELFPAVCVGTIIFLFEFCFAGRYGYFRDELYYIACSRHLAAGYVDFAPLAAWILRLDQMLFGRSLYALRWLPALAHGGLVVLTALITRELGGKRFAVLLSAVGVALVPVYIVNANRYAMNAFEPLFWMAAIYFLLRVINTGDAKSFLWLGLVCGIGIENKHSTVFFIAALLLALAVTPERRLFATKWFWAAVGITFVLALPNLVWQIIHGFPTYVDLHNVRVIHKNVELPPWPFTMQQINMLNLLFAWLWLPGIGFLFFARQGRRYRVLGFTFIFFYLGMMFAHAKDYYVAPIYPLLFAGGAVVWELLTRVRVHWLRYAMVTEILFGGAVAMPVLLPMLPPAETAAYINKVAGKSQKTENGMQSTLPQYFADEFGWRELVAKTAELFHSLPPDVQRQTAILGGSYGDAGAIDFFGPQYGLPPSISAHQNYWYWGPRNYTGESVILLDWPREDAERHCNTVIPGPTLDNRWSMDEEHYTIWLCKGMHPGLKEFWPDLKNWN